MSSFRENFKGVAICRRLRFDFLFAQFCQSGEGSFAFSGFFAFALATRELDTVVMNGAFENAIMVRTSRGDDMVLRRLGGNGLEQLLKFAFGIFQNGNAGEFTESALKFADDELAGSLETAVEKYCAKKGFESVGQS